MWEKNHSCPAHGAAAVSPQGNAQTMKMAFQGHISVFSGTPGKCALWIYYVCIIHYLATCKCGFPLISSHTCVVMWEALPQSLSSVSNLGCLHMSKPLFVLHGSSLVLRKCRKDSYVQKEQLWWTATFYGYTYGSVEKNTPDQDGPYTYRLRPRWLGVCNLSTDEEYILCRWLSEQLQVVPGWVEWLQPQVTGCDLVVTLCTTQVTGNCGRKVSLTPLTNLSVNI